MRLFVQASRFSRSMSRRTGAQRSLVAMRVLSNLEGQPLRVGELAAREMVTQPAMTTTLNRLATDGLVERHVDADDARAALVALTDAGHDALASFRARAANAARPVLDELADDDLTTLVRAADLLERLVATLDPP